MTKLLKADFSRLFKSASFWVCVFAGFIWGVFKEYYYIADNSSNTLYICKVFDSYPGIPIIIAVLISLFVGTDFSNKTIRNKITIGYLRSSVYLSYIIVGIVGGFAVNLTYIVGNYAIGMIYGAKTYFYSHFASMLIIDFAAYAALCSFLVMLCLMIGRKTVGSIAALIILFFTPKMASIIHNAVSQPKSFITVIPSPVYISGVKRVIYTVADNFFPIGQLEQLQSGDVYEQSQMIGYPQYSLGFIAVTTAAGIAVFRKKNIQ